MPYSNYETLYNAIRAYYAQQHNNSSTNTNHLFRMFENGGLLEQVDKSLKKEYNKLIKKDNIVYPDE